MYGVHCFVWAIAMQVVSKDEIFRLLKKFCEAVAPSGFEDDVRQRVIEELEPYADKLWVDAMGNVIAVKKGRGEGKLMLAAHMDEIGLMISAITKEGFLKFVPIGGWRDQVLPGQRVLIKTLSGELVRGVIGIKPPHVMKPEEAKQVIPMTELFIDVGASSREEVERMGITVGSVAVMDRDVERLGNPDRVTGRAFDDRVGLAVMVAAFRAIEDSPVDVYAVATVQEEVGLKGARTAAFAIAPDLGLAIDVTVAADVPGVPEHEYVTCIGRGPAIKVMDGRSGSGLIAHPAIRELLIKTAREEGIPYQIEVAPGGTTDASAMQLTREGIPVGTISIPTRYIHSAVEVLSLEDAVNAVKLITAFTKRINRSWIESVLRKTVK